MKKRVVRKERKSFRWWLAFYAEEREGVHAYETKQHQLCPVCIATHVIVRAYAREMCGVVLAEAGDEENEGEEEEDKGGNTRDERLRIYNGWRKRHVSASLLKSTKFVRRKVMDGLCSIICSGSR